MEMTEDQKQEIQSVFKKRRARQIMASVPVVGIILAFAFLEDQVKSEVLGISAESVGIIFSVTVLFIVGFSLKNWRCPSCNKYLGKGINPKFCTKCGVQLQ